MKVLVTGGAGFIGSHVVDTYIQHGHEVVVVDHLRSQKKKRVHDQARFYNVDIRSEQFEWVVEQEQPDIINHHAAQKSVPYSVKDPLYDADMNVMGFLNVLEACVKHQVNKIICASSGGALAGNKIPATEDLEPQFTSPYAISKYIGEKYLHFYSSHYGLNYTVLRYSNVYGPRQKADGESGAIPIFFNNYLANQPSVLMAYPDQPRGTTRDYIHVRDVAYANLLALDRGENEIIHIASGEEIHMEEIYELMQEVLGHELPLFRKGPRDGDVKRSCLDPSKAKEILGWEATVSLREGIEELRELHQCVKGEIS